MVSVRRSPHPWSASLVIVAASLLVTAGASADVAGCNGGSAVLPAIVGSAYTPATADRLDLDNGHSAVRSARSAHLGFYAGDCDDRSDGDDDTDVPEKEWARYVSHFGHDLIPVDNDFRPGLIDALSIPSSSFQRLRC